MTKANITQYSSTPSSNADINDINIAENCPASGLNNAIRELMAHLKNVDTGSQALTALSVTGVLTANGGAVFNEGGADVDFRVESDTVTHALFVNGANGDVGIGTSSPSTFGKFAVVGGNAYADGGYFAKNSSSTADTILKMPLTVSTLFLRPNGDNTVEFFNDVYGSALSINQTNVGIGTSSPQSNLHLGELTVIGQDINSGYFGTNFTATGCKLY